ncbi:hypothetical protein [Streptomyces fuscigenes]|uniref:hypothetical protein n=1 Tax=Streptomyces fuscigenes TaxID=1528880 RepID=UPI001F3CBC0B|nr:hypothetical protein [Streptomyces fuscigenes]MCF3960211.1 hypothetical protein [Streptomyces fuscigenes]
MLILSGNHRTAAAVEVGLPEIDCMLIDDPQQIETTLSGVKSEAEAFHDPAHR